MTLVTPHRARLVTVAAVVMFGVGCAPSAAQTTAPAAQQTTGDASRGRQLFQATCAVCHGSDAKGLPFLGKDLTTSQFVKSQTDAQLVEFVKKGRPANDPANTTHVEMPARGGNPGITDAQLADIVAFVHSLGR